MLTSIATKYATVAHDDDSFWNLAATVHYKYSNLTYKQTKCKYHASTEEYAQKIARERRSRRNNLNSNNAVCHVVPIIYCSGCITAEAMFDHSSFPNANLVITGGTGDFQCIQGSGCTQAIANLPEGLNTFIYNCKHDLIEGKLRGRARSCHIRA